MRLRVLSHCIYFIIQLRIVFHSEPESQRFSRQNSILEVTDYTLTMFLKMWFSTHSFRIILVLGKHTDSWAMPQVSSIRVSWHGSQEYVFLTSYLLYSPLKFKKYYPKHRQKVILRVEGARGGDICHLLVCYGKENRATLSQKLRATGISGTT